MRNALPFVGPRTVQAIRAAAMLERKVITALNQRWTVARIRSRYNVSADYVRHVAGRHDLSVERPSDNWVGRT